MYLLYLRTITIELDDGFGKKTFYNFTIIFSLFTKTFELKYIFASLKG